MSGTASTNNRTNPYTFRDWHRLRDSLDDVIRARIEVERAFRTLDELYNDRIIYPLHNVTPGTREQIEPDRDLELAYLEREYREQQERPQFHKSIYGCSTCDIYSSLFPDYISNVRHEKIFLKKLKEFLDHCDKEHMGQRPIKPKHNTKTHRQIGQRRIYNERYIHIQEPEYHNAHISLTNRVIPRPIEDTPNERRR